ncbi:MAG: nucleotidyltransferase domain-containing protein [Elusimicrobia bacterium]|nr:nucleotidyltransferase domain-containing protein [Elusimicrobiota bacterium]
MNIEHYPLKKFKKQIKEIAGKYLDLSGYKLFLFGSRVLNKGDERSDIDIGIEGEEAIPHEIMAKIREEAENIQVLYKIGRSHSFPLQISSKSRPRGQSRHLMKHSFQN